MNQINFRYKIIENDNLFRSIDRCGSSRVKTVKTSKSVGSDEIPTRLLKEGAIFLVEPICHLFNSCVVDRSIPSCWKNGIIIPVPKSHPSQMKQRNPITLMPIISKVFETVVLSSVRDRLLQYVEGNQFGCILHSSTTSALLTLHDRITSEMEREDTTGVVLGLQQGL